MASQWVWLHDAVVLIEKAAGVSKPEAQRILRICLVQRVRPILVERSGSYFTVTRSGADTDGIASAISVQLGESHHSHTQETLAAAHYSDFAFYLPALHAWLKVRKLGFSVSKWDKWMNTTFNFLNDRELLFCKPVLPQSTLLSKQPTGSTISFDDLKLLTGYSQPRDIKAWLGNNNIPFKTGVRGRPVTTVHALNCALGCIESETSGQPAKRVISV